MAISLAGKLFLIGVALHFLKKLVDRLLAVTYPVYSHGIILITGASTGIGRHAAQSLAKQGYVVLAGVRSDSDFNSIQDCGLSNLIPVFLDVTNEIECKSVIQKVNTMMEKLPFVALVNNAGTMQSCPIEFHSLNDQRFLFETNVFGAINLIQKSIPLLRKNSGRIINVTSLAGIAAPPLQGVYAASKHALEGYSDSLRRELSQFGISVSVIQPAFVKSCLQESATKYSVKSESNEPHNNSDVCDFKSLYSQQYNKSNSNDVVRNIKLADTPFITTWAITDAIVNPRPRARYPVANAKGIPTWVLVYVFSLVPDRLIDAVISPIHL